MKIAVLLDFLLGEGSVSAAASFPMLFLDLFFVGLATVAGPSPAPPAAATAAAAAFFCGLPLDRFFLGLATVAGPSPAPPAAKPRAKNRKPIASVEDSCL